MRTVANPTEMAIHEGSAGDVKYDRPFGSLEARLATGPMHRYIRRNRRLVANSAMQCGLGPAARANNYELDLSPAVWLIQS